VLDILAVALVIVATFFGLFEIIGWWAGYPTAVVALAASRLLIAEPGELAAHRPSLAKLFNPPGRSERE
jgi:hypothetical protein